MRYHPTASEDCMGKPLYGPEKGNVYARYLANIKVGSGGSPP